VHVDQPTNEERVTATLLIAKIRAFADTLDERERPLFAALLAPGVGAAWSTPDDDDADALSGVSFEWRSDRLPTHLARAIHDTDLRITDHPR
jgi:hypothetical protein